MIEIIPNRGSSAWDAYVSARPEATIYHLSGWGPIAERSYGIRPYLALARDGKGGPIRGGLPLFVVSRPFHRYITTGLFGAYGAVLADDEATRAEVCEAARRFAIEQRAAHLEIKGLGAAPPPRGFTQLDQWVTARLPLAGDAARVLKGLRKSIRAAIKQAEKANLEVRWGRAGLDAFYDVLSANMHRKGSPIYGTTFMRGILEAFEGADVITLWSEGKPISGALAVAFNRTMCVPFASSRQAHFHLRPNNLLYWKIIERSCERGLTTLDYGRSIAGTSTLDFKLHWGAVTEPVPAYIWTPGGEQPTMSPDSPVVHTVVKLWQKMPRRAVDTLGPLLSRYIV